MDPAIQFERVTKLYGRQVALSNVSFEVPQGVVFAVLGENGAGKTTAIKILLGLAEGDAGRSRVLGFDSRRQGLQIRQCVGYVPERPTLYEWMTVEEIGWFTAGFYGDGFLPRYRQLTCGFHLPWQQQLKICPRACARKWLCPWPWLTTRNSWCSTSPPRVWIRSSVANSWKAWWTGQPRERPCFSRATRFTKSSESPTSWRFARGAVVSCRKVGNAQTAVPRSHAHVGRRCGTTPCIRGRGAAQCRRARQWQGLVRNAADDVLAGLRESSSVAAVEVRTPSLEEILVGYLRRESPQEEGSDKQEVLP